MVSELEIYDFDGSGRIQKEFQQIKAVFEEKRHYERVFRGSHWRRLWCNSSCLHWKECEIRRLEGRMETDNGSLERVYLQGPKCAWPHSGNVLSASGDSVFPFGILGETPKNQSNGLGG